MTAPAPGSAEWFKIVTASKIPAIIGISIYDSPRSLWHKMRGDVEAPHIEPDTAPDDIRSRGHFLEDGVLAWWQAYHPDFTGYRKHPEVVRDDLPWASAGPDAEAINPDGVREFLEAKTGANADEWGDEGTDEIPAMYAAQCHWQMAMAPDVARVRVPVLLGPGLRFAEYIVERDQGVCDDLIEVACAFWESLSGDVPPLIDSHPMTFEVLKALHPDIDKNAEVELERDLAIAYLQADEDVKEAESRLTEAKSRIIDQMGRARLAKYGSTTVARRQPNRAGVSLVRVASIYDIKESE